MGYLGGIVQRAALKIALAISWLVVFSSLSAAASLSGTVTIAGLPAEEAVVYLESIADHPAFPPTTPAVIDQRHLSFFPRILPVVQGTTVTFTNSDNVQHGIFSPSAIAGKFNLGTYGRGEERQVIFTEPGEVVVLCNTHLEMEARILVLKDPYFTITKTSGKYHIANVPPGTYFLRVWRDRLHAFSEPLELSLTGDLTLDLRIK